jgi:arylsulfatase A-like enzyme
VNGDFRLKGDFVGAPGWGPIREDQDTISELLRKSGYRTCLISSVYHMFKPSKNFWRGFDQWDFVRGKETDTYRSGPLPTQEEIDYWLPHNMKNERRVKVISKELVNMHERMKHEEDSIVAQVAIKASNWLQENRNAKNFFLVVESFDPHEPWFVPKQYRLMYDNSDAHEQVLSIYGDTSKMPPEILHRTQANYSGLVTMCDRWFGYLYETMKNLGLLDNTVLIVTSDHGHSIGENNYMGKRGYPSTREVFDIPLLIRYPNKIGAGQKSDLLIQHTDISALILDFAKVNPLKPIHGKKFWENAIKSGKPIRDHVTVGFRTGITVINDEWWLNCKIDGKGAFLYDLNKDPLLKKNVAKEHQNVVDYLFGKGLDDAGGNFPDYLLQLARKETDFPGCSPLAVRYQEQER